MLKKRFFISWFSSVIIMFGLSLLWHGVVLNDLIHAPKPLYLFMVYLGLVYLFIGFCLTFTFTYLSMGIGIRMKGGLIGIALGFCIYLIAFVFGISFKGSGTEHVLVDFIWQMIEQGIGGVVVGFVYKLARNRDKILGIQ
jgi:hypothetical protein